MTETLPPFFRPIRLDCVGSASDEAKGLAAAGALEGTLVTAAEQSAGRGRRGRAWVSSRGNLHASLILRPGGPAAVAAQLGFATALAVAESVARFLPPGAAIACKWPNDVLIGGRKTAGILLESQADSVGTLDWLVIGIGVNLAAYPEGTEHPATSLVAAGGAAVTPEAFLPILAERLLAWYQSWRGAGFAAVRTAWLARADGLGGEIRVRLPREELTGRFAGLDEAGLLLLDRPQGTRRIASAEIFAAA